MKTLRKPQASKGWHCRKYKEDNEKPLKPFKKKRKIKDKFNECE